MSEQITDEKRKEFDLAVDTIGKALTKASPSRQLGHVALMACLNLTMDCDDSIEVDFDGSLCKFTKTKNPKN